MIHKGMIAAILDQVGGNVLCWNNDPSTGYSFLNEFKTFTYFLSWFNWQFLKLFFFFVCFYHCISFCKFPPKYAEKMCHQIEAAPYLAAYCKVWIAPSRCVSLDIISPVFFPNRRSTLFQSLPSQMPSPRVNWPSSKSKSPVNWSAMECRSTSFPLMMSLWQRSTQPWM